MSAGQYDIILDQGATFALQLVLKQPDRTAVDLTGYTVKAQLRTSYTATDKVEMTAVVTNAMAGTILIGLSAVATAALELPKYVYDVEAIQGDVIQKILAGSIIVNPEVTR